MLDIPLLQACLKQQEMLEQIVAPPGIALDRDSLADAVQFLASYSDLLDRVQRRLLFKAGREAHPETPAIGSLLTALIEAAIARGHLLKRTVELCGPVRPVDRSEDLEVALTRLDRILDVHSRDWPQEVIPSKEEVLESHKKGEAQKLSAAFAEMAGLDEAAWEVRVEQYRRKKTPGEGAA